MVQKGLHVLLLDAVHLLSIHQAPPEDYEQILAALSLSISTRQTRLTELALRERRATLWATTYTLAGWILYSFVWWLGIVPRIFQERTRSNLEIEKVFHFTPVIIGPFTCVQRAITPGIC